MLKLLIILSYGERILNGGESCGTRRTSDEGKPPNSGEDFVVVDIFDDSLHCEFLDRTNPKNPFRLVSSKPSRNAITLFHVNGPN